MILGYIDYVSINTLLDPLNDSDLTTNCYNNHNDSLYNILKYVLQFFVDKTSNNRDEYILNNNLCIENKHIQIMNVMNKMTRIKYAMIKIHVTAIPYLIK